MEGAHTASLTPALQPSDHAGGAGHERNLMCHVHCLSVLGKLPEAVVADEADAADEGSALHPLHALNLPEAQVARIPRVIGALQAKRVPAG